MATDITAPYTPSVPRDENYEPAPEGQYIGICYIMAMLGTQPHSFGNAEPTYHPSIILGFELHGDHVMKDGKPFSIYTKVMKFSSHEKANLRKTIEAWRGSRYTEQQMMEMGGLPVSKLIGQAAYITVQQGKSKNGEKTYSNIFSLVKAPKGLPIPAGVNPHIIYSASQHSDESFSKLTPFLQAKIMSSPEYQRWSERNKPKNPSHPEARIPVDDAIHGDEIPF